MKRFLYILLLLLNLNSFGQEVLNFRYGLNHGAATFGSVIATDSCYYVSGLQTDFASPVYFKGAFARINFDGSIESLYTLDIDSLGENLWENPNLIRTQDGNFAQIARVVTADLKEMFLFVKFSAQCDTIVTTLIDEILYEDLYNGLQPSILFENADSSFIGIVDNYQPSNGLSKLALIKLDKNGNLLWKKYFSGLGPAYFRILLGRSLLKYDENTYIIGSTMIDTYGSGYESHRYVPKLIFVDSLGNLQNEIIFWEDSLVTEIRGLTKTADGGVLWCGQTGIHNTDLGGLDFKRSITKLKPDFTKEWQIEEGKYTAYYLNDNNMIETINDSEFVAVGNYIDSTNTNTSGNLTKFNIEGEVLWSREYVNVPHFWGESNGPTHILYDVDMTVDSGFVMVGQSHNYYDNGYGIGQQAWLVKVDKHGCLVPDCQLYDSPVDTTDTVVVVPPLEPMPDVLYPNPSNQEIYYYHHQDEFTGKAEGFIYSAAGKRIYYWSVDQNDITYIIDTGSLESGMYIMLIKEGDEVVRKEKFVVEH